MSIVTILLIVALVFFIVAALPRNWIAWGFVCLTLALLIRVGVLPGVG